MDEFGKDFSFFSLPVDADKKEPTREDGGPEPDRKQEPYREPDTTQNPKTDASSEISSASEDFSAGGPGFEGLRYRIRNVMGTTRYQLVVVALVIADMTLVIGQLMLDLEGANHVISMVFHCASLAVLSIFVLEVAIKMIAHGFEFLTHKLEVFDSTVVIVAFILDVIYLDSSDAHSGLGLIIILRLWRLVRIQNAMMLQVRRVEEKKLHTERQNRLKVEEELQRCRAHIATLQQKLSANNIAFESEIRLHSVDIP